MLPDDFQHRLSEINRRRTISRPDGPRRAAPAATDRTGSPTRASQALSPLPELSTGQLPPNQLPSSQLPGTLKTQSNGMPAVVTAPQTPSTLDHIAAHEIRGDRYENARGEHLWIRQSLAEIWPSGSCWLSRLLAKWQDHGHLPEESHDEFDAVQRFFPERVVFLDLETCGFAGSMVFLIGIVHFDRGDLVLSQLWARNYAEEAAVLVTLWQIMQTNCVLVSFNGKSFDWPQVHDRSTLHRIGRASARKHSRATGQATIALPSVSEGPSALFDLLPQSPRVDPIHCDLLHHARRRWKDALPNCRLQTLERFICGRNRRGDIPGHEIPEAYHDYVRTGETERVKSILHHNALDLVTLLQLTVHCVLLEQGTNDGKLARAG